MIGNSTESHPNFDPEDETPLVGIEIEIPAEDGWLPEATPYDDFEGDQDAPQDEPVGIRGFVEPPSYVRTGSEAVRWALGRSSWSPPGYCQQFTRSAFNVAAHFGSAAAAWHGANNRHSITDVNNIPRGVPVFWLGGSRGYGHVAVSLGNGLCRTTDWPSSGRVGTARIDDVTRSWRQKLVGWTEDINEVPIWKPDLPIVRARNVARKTRQGLPVPQGVRIKKAVAAEVGQGGMSFEHTVLGVGFRKQYQLLQEKYLLSEGLEASPKAADGIPGINSLTWLGDRHGFNVRP